MNCINKTNGQSDWLKLEHWRTFTLWFAVRNAGDSMKGKKAPKKKKKKIQLLSLKSAKSFQKYSWTLGRKQLHFFHTTALLYIQCGQTLAKLFSLFWLTRTDILHKFKLYHLILFSGCTLRPFSSTSFLPLSRDSENNPLILLHVSYLPDVTK